MIEADFHEQIDSIFERLEEVLEDAADAAGEDVDCDMAGGVLTLTFANGSSMILSRQSATSQLWLAARGGGFHFAQDETKENWRCTRSGEQFDVMFRDQLESQTGIELPEAWL